jgi:hypothetical protein
MSSFLSFFLFCLFLSLYKNSHVNSVGFFDVKQCSLFFDWGTLGVVQWSLPISIDRCGHFGFDHSFLLFQNLLIFG